MAELVRNETDKQADQKLDHKGDRSFHNVDRIDQICNGKSDSSADSAVQAAKKECAEDDEGISEMNGNLTCSGSGNADGKIGKYDIGDGCEYAGKNQLAQSAVLYSVL